MEVAAKQREEIEKNFRCPHCDKLVSEKVRTCPHCNGPLFHGGTTIETPVCPRCRVELKKMKTEGEDEVETCPQCHGFWLDYQSFARAINPQRLPKEYLESKDSWHKPQNDPIQYVSCPRCGRYMNRENFSRISGIVIDRCRDHGVWLDAGELERIRLFIANGGLERLQDKRLETLNIEMQELAGRVRGEEFMTRLLNFWNPKRIFFKGRF
jgi:Zn-finger nucleic acid-binding protein